MKKGIEEFMKRRKVVGLILLIATVVYLVASFLALYQNQRVKMEKQIEEALKVYSEKESQSVKELNKDINLLLEEKTDINDFNQEKMNNEGSFARIDKNVSNVTNQITTMDKNITNVKDEIIVMENQINNLNDKVIQIENFYKTFYEEMISMNSALKEEIAQNKDTIIVIKEEIESITDRISEIEKQLEESELRQDEDIKKLQEQLQQFEERMTTVEGNVLYYRFNEESLTLEVYGNKVQPEDE